MSWIQFTVTNQLNMQKKYYSVLVSVYTMLVDTIQSFLENHVLNIATKDKLL